MSFLVLTALLLVGWGVSVAVWLWWFPQESDSPPYYFLIGLFALAGVQTVEPGRRYRIRCAVILAVAVGWYLIPSTSATASQRASLVFSDPLFAFRASGTVPLIVAFSLVAYFLLWLRHLLNSMNSRVGKTKETEGSSE
jgi:hypothetical protein